MGRNVEIKARVADLAKLVERVEAIAGRGPTELHQVDVFFPCERGRLKLRKFPDGTGELIFYQRADTLEPEESRYELSPTAAPESLEAALAGALGVGGEVRKKRLLYFAGQTRVHLDEVVGLGAFLELEVVLDRDQSRAEGLAIARDLMGRLGVTRDDLVAEAYIDILAGGGRGGEP